MIRQTVFSTLFLEAVDIGAKDDSAAVEGANGLLEPDSTGEARLNSLVYLWNFHWNRLQKANNIVDTMQVGRT